MLLSWSDRVSVQSDPVAVNRSCTWNSARDVVLKLWVYLGFLRSKKLQSRAPSRGVFITVVVTVAVLDFDVDLENPNREFVEVLLSGPLSLRDSQDVETGRLAVHLDVLGDESLIGILCARDTGQGFYVALKKQEELHHMDTSQLRRFETAKQKSAVRSSMEIKKWYMFGHVSATVLEVQTQEMVERCGDFKSIVSCAPSDERQLDSATSSIAKTWKSRRAWSTGNSAKEEGQAMDMLNEKRGKDVIFETYAVGICGQECAAVSAQEVRAWIFVWNTNYGDFEGVEPEHGQEKNCQALSASMSDAGLACEDHLVEIYLVPWENEVCDFREIREAQSMLRRGK